MFLCTFAFVLLQSSLRPTRVHNIHYDLFYRLPIINLNDIYIFFLFFNYTSSNVMLQDNIH